MTTGIFPIGPRLAITAAFIATILTACSASSGGPHPSSCASSSTEAGKVSLLYSAIDSGDAEVVAQMSAPPSNPDIADSECYTGLMYAAATGNLPALQALLKSGANPNLASSSFFTPLMLASDNGHLPIVEVLLASGSQVDAVDFQMASALHRAAFIGNAALVRLFLERGADVNRKDVFGNTPILFAAISRDEKTIRALIEAGADPLMPNENSLTAAKVAEKHGFRKLLEKAQ